MKIYPNLDLVQRSSYTLTFDVRDADGNGIDVSGATITAWCKRQLDDSTAYLFQKADGDFSKNVGGLNYRISVPVTKANMNFYGKAYFICQLNITADESEPKFIVQFTVVQSPESGA
jgi:hypothetical protein